MKITAFACALPLLLSGSMLLAAPRQHAVSLGKITVVQWLVGSNGDTVVQLRVRPLAVDGHIKEFVVGTTHDVTERTFVAQRAYRLNDSLPQETSANRWRWERGGWLLIDRVTGRLQPIQLPAFDPYSSRMSWYRDYAAYCGLADDGKSLVAVVWQLGKRKPLFKKRAGDATGDDMPDSECPSPVWQRSPARVTFDPPKDQPFTYTVRSRAVELVAEDEDEGEE